jgi:hypothetical protein
MDRARWQLAHRSASCKKEHSMSSPGNHPRNNKPQNSKPQNSKPAGPSGVKAARQPLRVHNEDGTPSSAAPSILMPRANTELTEMMAGDALLCVRPRAKPTPQPAAAASPAVEASRMESTDGDLSGVVEAWPDLPRNVRAAIVAMVRPVRTGE